LRVKEMEKSIGEWIYPNLGKRIPQETSRIAGGKTWSPGIAVGRRRGVGEEERKKNGQRGYGMPLYRPRTRYIGYIRSSGYVQPDPDISELGWIYPMI
jgi:hypothetical protein